MNQVKIAEQIARESHKEQKRWGGEPYITHPEAIANFFKVNELKIIAWLHDVLEDTEVTAEILCDAGIQDDLIKSIYILTRKDNEEYLDYILRVSEDDNAKQVKIADLNHNLSDLKKGSMRDKYLMALHILKESF